MDKNKKIYYIVGLVLVVALAFYLGTLTNKNKGNNFSQNRTGQVGMQQNFINGMQKGQRNFGGMVAGKILSMDDKSITLENRDGGSRIILLSASTTIQKSILGTLTDLKVGEQISVLGKADTSGTVAAQSIQINIGTSTPIR
ncbi:MAG: hypothetical protein WC827_00525 [Candidatus Paceibacterota bacterium]|jgi:hypothetical protein